MNYFYEKNTEFVESEWNKTFEEILRMTQDEFREFCRGMRKEVIRLWDEKGMPPRVGYSESEIVDQFNGMTSFPVQDFLVRDEHDGELNVVRNTSNIGNSVNQWFPTMMKTKINYGKDLSFGKSIYDYFAKEELYESFMLYTTRNFKRDSFYWYSLPIHKGQVVEVGSYSHKVTSAKAFLEWFEANARNYNTHEYWLDGSEEEREEYNSYNDNGGKKFLTISKKDALALNLPWWTMTNMDHKDAKFFRVRLYKKTQKIFPLGLKAFRISYCQYAVNFPPLTAKFLYEHFTDHIKDQECINLYDPSAGWAGRLLGALAVNDERNIHYIGTDPNTDHNTTEGRTKYHEIADFFNTKTYRGRGLFPKIHSYEIYQLGSEVIGDNPDFQKYKGKLDLVFTSPPYFSREAYSDDETQSYKKFSDYDSWREGFLKPTLKTCVDYLRSNRYLLWNVADVEYGTGFLPLENDSIEYLKSLGMEHLGVMKMALAPMPGSHRINTETGLPKTRNFCKVNGIWLKHEPVFVFRKP